MIKLHKILFPTDNRRLVWDIYYNIRDTKKFKDLRGQNKMKAIFAYIRDNFQRLEQEQLTLVSQQEPDLIIKNPIKFSEFEVQATLYAILKFNHKLDVRGEVHYKMPTYGELKASSSRFDLVVFKNGEAICIIEVKNNKKTKINENTRQFKKYSKFGIKLIYCMNMGFVNEVVQEVLEFHKNYFKGFDEGISKMFSDRL